MEVKEEGSYFRSSRKNYPKVALPKWMQSEK